LDDIIIFDGPLTLLISISVTFGYFRKSDGRECRGTEDKERGGEQPGGLCETTTTTHWPTTKSIDSSHSSCEILILDDYYF
jgi:hypothetical protein